MAVFLMAVLSPFIGIADMGSIVFVRNAEVFEPSQKAFIAWNGKEEILVLSTDLRASKKTKILEVMPLPSKPEVKKSDVAIFEKAVKIINDRKGGYVELSLGAGARTGRDSPPARVVFQEKIGAHDVSVLEVLSTRGFVEWTERYLKELDAEAPTIPRPLRNVIGEYLKDKFTWFVFDVVELTKEIKTKEAIQFRFKSDYLYYPLRITKTEKGDTTVSLLILTKNLLSSEFNVGISVKNIRRPHVPVWLDEDELKDLNQEMYELLGKPKNSRLRIWQLKGKLSSFKRDILIGQSDAPGKTDEDEPPIPAL